MKKIYSGLLMAALCLTACKKDDATPSNNGNNNGNSTAPNTITFVDKGKSRTISKKGIIDEAEHVVCLWNKEHSAQSSFIGVIVTSEIADLKLNGYTYGGQIDGIGKYKLAAGEYWLREDASSFGERVDSGYLNISSITPQDEYYHIKGDFEAWVSTDGAQARKITGTIDCKEAEKN